MAFGAFFLPILIPDPLLHSHVFWACHWSIEVEILEVNCAVACTIGQDDTVDMKLDRDHVDSGRTTITGKIE